LSIDLDILDRLAAIVQRTPLKTLEYKALGQRIRLTKAGAEAFSAPPQRPASPSLPVRCDATALASASAATSAPAVAVEPAKRHVVCAGLNGSFCSAPGPGQPPYVRVGDQVSEGQVLGVVEAMKMLNEIEADRAGCVVRILVEDGASVQPTTPLFEIE
jgi:acetyl-CoA carboxylase biotin carboxyl carrier protein